MKGAKTMAQPALQIKKEEPTGLGLVKPADLVEEVAETCDAIGRRAFEIFESRGSVFGRDLEDWFEAESELLHPVHADVTESAEGFTLSAEVPGFRADELKVSVDGTRLTVAGKKEREQWKEAAILSDRCPNRLLRVINLPAALNAEKAKATLKDGILLLDLPKAASATRIVVEVG
jgi:HSP20 family protein